MEYYYSKVLTTSFDEAIQKATDALKAEGFGIISDIDIRSKLHEKLGVEFKRYRILGACNPGFASRHFSLKIKSAPCCHAMLP